MRRRSLFTALLAAMLIASGRNAEQPSISPASIAQQVDPDPDSHVTVIQVPNLRLTVDGKEILVKMGRYCWRQTNLDKVDVFCADTAAPPDLLRDAAPVTVPANSVVEWRVEPFARPQPGQIADVGYGFASQLHLWDNGTASPAAMRDDGTALIPSKPGIYVYEVSISGKDMAGSGDVVYAFKVEVK